MTVVSGLRSLPSKVPTLGGVPACPAPPFAIGPEAVVGVPLRAVRLRCVERRQCVASQKVGSKGHRFEMRRVDAAPVQACRTALACRVSVVAGVIDRVAVGDRAGVVHVGPPMARHRECVSHSETAVSGLLTPSRSPEPTTVSGHLVSLCEPLNQGEFPPVSHHERVAPLLPPPQMLDAPALSELDGGASIDLAGTSFDSAHSSSVDPCRNGYRS